ncbi:hypothetical protein EYZ11_008422 [Aspergillus tanneri]|uniref:RRM domain-containing protein n=1 Tax=Aspergillus tanneri TaxID=1220188 RepID=A0A4S3JCP8_9EURO|nr:uncharacterized protein ATNIH1004_010213 [Aspergillus tanneri]KAA8643444.1 hypothetical protein ATNIH1004_010213 [Aspergillus tanneri]THC92127.1 hypothetical protein EYZ11_008422 [Aspergillus tanneri]
MASYVPSEPPQPDIISPMSRRAAPASLYQLLHNDAENQSRSPQRLSEVAKSFENVALPSEMPIGSYVHLWEPPKWGVIKISNIPYSITKQEIVQFVGRQARLITPDKGCAIHIIMERSTAKTMDCYVEFETKTNAQETVNRINQIYETGRPPRLGNRHVDVELSSQDALLKNLFPRAKCVSWKDGIPYALPNTDPYSTGFAGLFTSEEIVGAIRHAEMPHRSPFCAKCPQRTYESTISTLYKFPWFATKLYTVDERNQLFDMTNRHIMSLVSRIKRSNTVGLDQRLLRDLLYAGLNCPAFNERQKYTLCVNSEDMREILRFSDLDKWFPFDTLVKIPQHSRTTHRYYASLISKVGISDYDVPGLPNNFPTENVELYSPYGPIWFEWETTVAKDMIWDDAVQHEMIILCNLVLSGWINSDRESKVSGSSTECSPSDSAAQSNLALSSTDSGKSRAFTDSATKIETFVTHARRASMAVTSSGPFGTSNESTWNQRLLLYPSAKARSRPYGHRITQSSPTCFPSSEEK